MNIVITGSLGNISKPLTQQLVKAGHQVTVISSTSERQAQIEANGAKAAIGTMQDVDFLTNTFTGADAVYLMESLGHDFFFNKEIDANAELIKIGENYKQAVEQSGVKRIVHLSSIGAHTNQGNGILAFHHDIEQILKQLPDDVAITTLRPVGFYYNMFSFIPLIKNMGVIASNYTTTYKEPWVSPLDIADVAAVELTTAFAGRKVRYIASDELTSDEVATILGEAIGKPDLQWIVITDEQQLDGMLKAGMNIQTAKGLVEMNTARGTGELFEDYFKNKPALGKVKLTDFAKDFTAAYHQKQ
ncbi:NAD-dependent epimerase/dehydratase family protein [Mucilaginibacter limnophilus]|uniref:NAD-dependent epimerase/dehydratase family protein n=1 Tax=Mucilaginibacter limnophilus TaxID=1932778 RepID=A0A3S2Y3T5_9SPHI|nr:NAD(P)H-binding protein [Mucilaginibacter limnophilus]RVU02881.1 NAD-dependent epimerase/dehydratase family protein [Mucilaginibacter limnophilus]